MKMMSTSSGSREVLPVAARPGGVRAREREWRRELAQELRRFAGEWVVVEGERVVSHGTDAGAAVASARAEGVPVPYVFFVELDEEVDFRIGL